MTMTAKHVPAGRFKAECLGLIDRVAETREPFIITKHGRPVVQVIPMPAESSAALVGSVTVHGDIVGPILGAWDADR
jgi:prevent-host-death family protein